MAKTLGYYRIENHFRKLQAWPTKDGFRGCKGTIICLVNIMWAAYPITNSITNIKTNLQTSLLHMELFLIGMVYLFISSYFIYYKRDLLELINQMSNFKSFGIPKKLIKLEKFTNITLNSSYWFGTVCAYTTSNALLFSKDCGIETTSGGTVTSCLLIPYYKASSAKPWQILLTVLFQTVMIETILHLFFVTLWYYVYTSNLLIIRLEEIRSKIMEIHFTSGQKNCKALRHVIEYHQETVRLFKILTDFGTVHIFPTKLFMLVSLCISAGSVLPNVFVIVVTITCLFAAYTIGQQITSAGSDIADAVYNLNWYDADILLQKEIYIFLYITQRTLIIKMGMLGVVSHETMTKDLKNTYVLINWLYKFLK